MHHQRYVVTYHLLFSGQALDILIKIINLKVVNLYMIFKLYNLVIMPCFFGFSNFWDNIL